MKCIEGFDVKIDWKLILVCILGSLVGIFSTGCASIMVPGPQYLTIHVISEALDLYKYQEVSKK